MTIAHAAISPSRRGPYELESRMREICKSGSEGGRAQTHVFSLPLSFRRVPAIFLKLLPIRLRVARAVQHSG